MERRVRRKSHARCGAGEKSEVETLEIYLSLLGKIPNLQEYLATCRKYSISIVPIFQSFSQIEKVYGKEDANSIYANCDTTLFLGGIDSQTLKIVCERLGKETVRSLTMNLGKKGGGNSAAPTAKEIMSRIQVEQMSNAKCLVFIRGLKPFWVKKFNLNGHPNYPYTAEADPDGHSFVNPFFCEYDDMEIESIRIKKVGEIGYNEPKEVNSARLRASKQQAQEARKDMAISLQRAASQYGKFDENAPYESEAEKRSVKANHEAYIEALKTTFIEAKENNDSYTMDVIRSTCYRYDIDIGLDIGMPRENVRERSSGRLNAEDRQILRELTEEEAVELMRQSGMVGSSIASGIKTEFDLATLEQVAINLGGMVKDVNGEDILNKIYKDTTAISKTEYKENKEEYTEEEGKNNNNNYNIEEFTVSENVQSEDEELLTLDDDENFDYVEDNFAESIEDVIEMNSRESEPYLEKDEREDDEDDVNEHDTLSEEEIQSELEGYIDFSEAEESEDYYDTYGEETSGEIEIDAEIKEDQEKSLTEVIDSNEFNEEKSDGNTKVKLEVEFNKDENKQENLDSEILKQNIIEEEKKKDVPSEITIEYEEVKAAEVKPKIKKNTRFMVLLDDDADDDFKF